MRVIAFASLAALVAGSAAAVEDYDACVALVDADPARAAREATDWAEFGGGAAARHCRALALSATGALSMAADELLGIAAEEPELTPEARADVLAQAGELLVEEGDLATASLAARQALSLAPSSPEAVALSASVMLASGNARGALGVLDRAGAQAPRLLVLRATAERRLGDMVAARDSAMRATELAPEMPRAWLERGRAAARIGDRGQARDALMRAIGLDREGAVGAEARLALQRMEAGFVE